MRVYVCGPMRGLPEFNFPAFFEAEAKLKAMGHEVVNPARLDRDEGFDETFEYDEDSLRLLLPGFIIRNVTELIGCDAVCLLDGWERSGGVKFELAVAAYMGLRVVGLEYGIVYRDCSVSQIVTIGENV
jgi:hypothetical protein